MTGAQHVKRVFSWIAIRNIRYSKNMPMLPTGLHRHPKSQVYYFRQRIPADVLAGYPGKREIVRSLRTKTYSVAMVRLHEQQRAITAEWDRCRQRLADRAAARQLDAIKVIDALSPEAIEAICNDFEAMSLAGDEARRLSAHPYEIEEIEEYRDGYAAAILEMKAVAATGDLDAIRAPLEQFLSLRRYLVRAPEHDMRRLALAFCRAAIRTNEKLLSRYEGQDVLTPERTTGLATPGLQKAVDAYISYYEALGKADMLRKVRAALQLLLEIVGNRPIGLLKQGDFETYFETIQHLPPRWKDVCRRRGLSPCEVAELGLGEISKSTFEGTYVAVLGPFVEYCQHKWQDDGWPMHLTVAGVRYIGSRRDPEAGQRAFTVTELQRLFQGPEMAEFAKDPMHAHKLWLPHLGLFTGARVNELCQLNPQSDVRQDSESGVWYLDITDASSGPEGVVKSVKTKGSRRRVPIHSTLVELGFLQYVTWVKQQGHTLLFPGFPPSRGRASPEAAKWFRNFLREIGLRDETPDARLVGMHAFRHTLLSQAKVLGVVNAEAITGHATIVTGLHQVQGDQTQGEKSQVVRRYEGELPVSKKAEILGRIHYDGVAFHKPVAPELHSAA